MGLDLPISKHLQLSSVVWEPSAHFVHSLVAESYSRIVLMGMELGFRVDNIRDDQRVPK